MKVLIITKSCSRLFKGKWSMRIIGSAAGVVAMGMEKINFFWYLKKISWLAFVGFFVGSITFILMRNFIF